MHRSSSRESRSGPPILGNAFWIIIGSGAPLIFAVVSIPWLLGELGTERFAILALAWTGLGYISLLDLGLGRALTRSIVRDELLTEPLRLKRATWTAIVVLFLLGLAAAAGFLPLVPWLTHTFLNVTSTTLPEAKSAFWLLAIGFPFVTVGSGLVGFLEASRKFRMLGLIRLAVGGLNYLAPLVAVLITGSLTGTVGAVVVVRGIMTVALIAACIRSTPGIGPRPQVDWRLVRPMLAFGAWLTASNLIAPTILYMDRFAIGALLPVAILAYYVTPQEIVTRLWIIPGAFASVLFPSFVPGASQHSDAQADLITRGLAAVFVVTFPVVLFLSTFSAPLLSLWLGPEFAEKSAPVLSWLAVGVLLNAGAQVLSTFVQAQGRADLTAKLLLVELPLYALLLVWLVPRFGILGAAYAWVARIVVDGGGLLLFTYRLAARRPSSAASTLAVWAIAVFLSILGNQIEPLAEKTFMFLVSVAGIFSYVWLRLMADVDRDFVRSALRRVRT